MKAVAPWVDLGWLVRLLWKLVGYDLIILTTWAGLGSAGRSKLLEARLHGWNDRQGLLHCWLYCVKWGWIVNCQEHFSLCCRVLVQSKTEKLGWWHTSCGHDENAEHLVQLDKTVACTLHLMRKHSKAKPNLLSSVSAVLRFELATENLLQFLFYSAFSTSYPSAFGVAKHNGTYTSQEFLLHLSIPCIPSSAFSNYYLSIASSYSKEQLVAYTIHQSLLPLSRSGAIKNGAGSAERSQI